MPYLTGLYSATCLVHALPDRSLLCHMSGPCITRQVSTLPPVWFMHYLTGIYSTTCIVHALPDRYLTTCMVHALPVRSLFYHLSGPCIVCQVSSLPPVWSIHCLTGLYSATCLVHALPDRSLLYHLSGPCISRSLHSIAVFPLHKRSLHLDPKVSERILNCLTGYTKLPVKLPNCLTATGLPGKALTVTSQANQSRQQL
jgi:hypothetical protein